MQTGLDIPYDSMGDAATFLGINPSVLSDRRTNRTNPDRPIKAKAKHLKGKIYRATFSTTCYASQRRYAYYHPSVSNASINHRKRFEVSSTNISMAKPKPG